LKPVMAIMLQIPMLEKAMMEHLLPVHLCSNTKRWVTGLLVMAVCTVRTACFPAPQDTSRHIKCWKPYALKYNLVLLKMGIMKPKTCWA